MLLRSFTLLALCLALVLHSANSSPVPSSANALQAADEVVGRGEPLGIVERASGGDDVEDEAESSADVADDDDDASDDEAHAHPLDARGKKHKKSKKAKAKAKKAKAKKAKAKAKARKVAAKKSHAVSKKSNSGKGSFFKPGMGACGWRSGSGDMIAAISGSKWDGGKHCGKSASVCHGSACVNVKIVDMCPSCAPGSLDLSPAAFKGLANLDLGIIGITWHFN